jgi:ankyrin repeat protein
MKTACLLVLLFLCFTCGCSDRSDLPRQTADAQPAPSAAFQNPDAVYEAALQGDIGTVGTYLDRGFGVNRADADQRSLLMLAAFNGHAELCRLLIEKGADVNARDAGGSTPLMFASTGPFVETVQLLLNSGADPNLVDTGEHFTALMHAAAEGQLEVVQALLKHGADKTKKDVDQDTAEAFARQKGHGSVADYIRNYK